MSSPRGASIRYDPNAVEESYALYLLRAVFRRDYSCEASLNLGAKEASVFFSLSGQDKALLKHIWVLVVLNEKNAETAMNVLTELSQFHTFLRFLALAQKGTLVEALAKAFRQAKHPKSEPEQANEENTLCNNPPRRITPARVMAECLLATRDAFIPLPRFAGIDIPKLPVLLLIYEQVCNGRSRDDVAKRKQATSLFLEYRQRNGEVPLDDSDRTIHTSNVTDLGQYEQSLDDNCSEASADEFATDTNEALGPSFYEASVGSCLNETESDARTFASDSARSDDALMSHTINAPTSCRIGSKCNLSTAIRGLSYLVTSLALIRIWTRRYRSVSLNGPVTGCLLLFLAALYMSGLISLNDIRRYSMCIDAMYVLLLLWSMLHSHSIVPTELGRLMERHCVPQVVMGFWLPRVAFPWPEKPEKASSKHKVE